MTELIGNLDCTSLAEVLRICSVQQKTGTLTICQGTVEKRLYFDSGSLIYVTSSKKGERVGEYLVKTGEITPNWSKFLLKDCQHNGMAFTSMLVEKKFITREKLESALATLASKALADAMNWTSGAFSFSTGVPPQVIDGPVRISEVAAWKQILRQNSETAPLSHKAAATMRQLAQNIATNMVLLPLLPNVAVKLQQHCNDADNSAAIFAMVRNDQVLSAHLLRVANAAINDNQGRYVTVNQVLAAMDSRHLLGIIHTQIACALPPLLPNNLDRLLRRALRCACMARLVARQVGENEDIAFTCGLFHNIGKIIMLHLLTDDSLLPKDRQQLISAYQHNCGAMLSRRWNLDPCIHDCIKYQHDPTTANANNKLVEIVYLSINLLHDGVAAADLLPRCPHLPKDALDIAALVRAIDHIETTVKAAYR